MRRAQQVAARSDFGVQIVALDPAQHGCFQAAEAKIERVALHAGEREAHRARIAVWREASITGPAG